MKPSRNLQTSLFCKYFLGVYPYAQSQPRVSKRPHNEAFNQGKTMKLRFLGVAICAMCATQSFATDQDKCTLTGLRAEIAMGARQGTIPMTRMLEIAGADEELKVIVRSAYEVPRYHTEYMKETAIADFRTLWERVCFKPAKGKTK
jgi:hypothetical protein